MAAPDLIAALQRQFSGKIGQGREFRREHLVEVDSEIIRAVADFLKNDFTMNFLGN